MYDILPDRGEPLSPKPERLVNGAAPADGRVSRGYIYGD